MDPLTHTLAGAAMTRTPLGRGTRLAGPALLLGANLPDVDVLAYFAGADAALGFRRGWTHGPLAVLVLPAVLTAALWAYDLFTRRRTPDPPAARPGRLLALSYLACLTHPLLDWLNTYGIRLLMPFDERWFYGDAVFIVDPWLWLVLGGAAYLGRSSTGVPWGWVVLATACGGVILLAGSFVPLAARLVWLVALVALAVLGRRRTFAGSPTVAAVTGAAVAVAYILALTATSALAASRVRAELPRLGVTEVRRLMVGPSPANPFRWDVVAETPLSYRYGSYRWFGSPELRLASRAIPLHRPSPVLEAALRAPHVQGARTWMRFPFAEIEETPQGYNVYLLDARYVRTRTRGFGAAVVELDRNLRVRAN